MHDMGHYAEALMTKGVVTPCEKEDPLVVWKSITYMYNIWLIAAFIDSIAKIKDSKVFTT